MKVLSLPVVARSHVHAFSRRLTRRWLRIIALSSQDWFDSLCFLPVCSGLARVISLVLVLRNSIENHSVVCGINVCDRYRIRGLREALPVGEHSKDSVK